MPSNAKARAPHPLICRQRFDLVAPVASGLVTLLLLLAVTVAVWLALVSAAAAAANRAALVDATILTAGVAR